MKELIDILENMSLKLIKGEKEEFVEMAPALNEKLWMLFPKIIIAYSRPELSDHASDATIWPGQLQKILEVLEGNDTFKIVDTLYYETRTMLLEFQKLIIDRNITIE